GQTDTHLGTLDVQGNISGTIFSNGPIDNIISREGVISAEIITRDPAFNADIGSITTANGFTGILDIDGDVGRFTSYATLGPDPATLPNMIPLRFDIAGDLGQLTIKGTKGGPPVDLFTTLYVGGDIGKLDIDGSLYADLLVNGNVGSMILDGNMGGVFLLPGVLTLGHVEILGYLGSLTLADGANIVSNLTTGGPIDKITLRDKSKNPLTGNVLGTITSRHGGIGSVSIQNGTLGGLNAATGIGKITMKGDRADPANITGDIIANGGGIDSLTITNGSLLADVKAMGGAIKKFSISGGTAAPGTLIYSSAGIGSLAVKNRAAAVPISFGASIITDADLKKLSISGTNMDGSLSVAGRADNLSIQGDLNGQLFVAGGFKSLNVRGNMNSASVATLYSMGKVAISGDVNNSSIIGGYDAATGAAHSADLKTLSVGGNWNASQLVLGVDPGPNTLFGDGDDLATLGVSSLGRMTVKGTASPVGSLIMAGTSLGQIPPSLNTPLSAKTVAGVTPPLDPDPAKQFFAGTYIAPDGVSITYKGTGRGSYDPATGDLVLQGGGFKHSLSIDNTGPAKTINVAGDDDLGLSNLTFRGNAVAGDITIQGPVGKLAVPAAASGSDWLLPGGVKSIATNTLVGVDVVAGAIGNWKLNGDFTRLVDEGLIADVLGSLSIAGNMTASVLTTIGGIKSLTVRGNIDGSLMNPIVSEAQVVSAGGLDKLSAKFRSR
ncbi:hypothetical protein LCGC14_1554420, partial [marine sediment metagenome]